MPLLVAPDLVLLDEEHPAYPGIRRQHFVALARQHPDAWRMHHINEQFHTIEGVNGIPAVRHCMVQAARARVLACLLRLDLITTNMLVKAALLHDSFKAHEVRYMRAVGPSWDSYDFAQQMAQQSWRQTRLFSEGVILIASSVAHESLVDMLVLAEKARLYGVGSLSPFEIAQLAMHYLDDITVEDQWAEPADGSSNIISVRMRRNASNPRYARLNEQGRTMLRAEAAKRGLPHFLHQETTYAAQEWVGYLVQDLLADLVGARTGGIAIRSVDLPVIIDNIIRQELNKMLANYTKG